MSQIKWEGVPDQDIRADVEAALESTGEAKKIRQMISQSTEFNEWQNQIQVICQNLIQEMHIDNVSADILYDRIAAMGLNTLPPKITEEIGKRVKYFLQNQFEDHP